MSEVSDFNQVIALSANTQCAFVCMSIHVFSFDFTLAVKGYLKFKFATLSVSNTSSVGILQIYDQICHKEE